MKAEHFGIAIVELIASGKIISNFSAVLKIFKGLIVIAHNSAGPKYDII